jgi:murein DD-endopeptidase MepM/ murein hydrolase activator NlpD
MTKIYPPCKGFVNKPYPYGSITQFYAENPILYGSVCPVLTPTKQCLVGHNGIDIVAPYGTELYAVEEATVCEVKDDAGGYGKHVRILTDITADGTRHEWTYGHLSVIKCTLGQKVKVGDVLGLMGNTGFVVSNSNANGFWKFNPYAGTHLHLGMRQLNRRGVVLNYENGYFGSMDYAGWLPEGDKVDMDAYNTVLNMQKLLIILQNAGIELRNPNQK